MSEQALVKTFQEVLRERLRSKYGLPPRATCLLMDTSGSMSGAPIVRLRDIASTFKSVRRFEFNSITQELAPKQVIGDATGSTNMAGAFSHVKTVGIAHVVLITDGQPDNQDAALASSKGLKIDIIYVGPEPAPPFLEKLANHTGGKYGEASLMSKEIETKIMGLLPAPASEGTIKL